LDEQWSFVDHKSNQRWLWHAVDHATNTVLAYVFGKRKDTVFQELKALLAPLMIGAHMSAILNQRRMKLAKQTPKKLFDVLSV